MNKTPETVESTELLPCPFCGSPAGWVPEGNHYVVGCGTCNGQVKRLEKGDAISSWNRRAHPLPSQQVTRGQQGECDCHPMMLTQAGELLHKDEFCEHTPPPEAGTPMGESAAHEAQRGKACS